MIEVIVNRIKENTFLKNIIVLVSGNMLGYVVNLLALPILARIYIPAQIGEYDLIVSSGRFVLEIISLGLIIAIMLPEKDEDAKGLCQLILFLNLIFISVLFIVLYLVRNLYRIFDTSSSYVLTLFLLGNYLLFFNLQSLFFSYTNRCKKYRVLFWNPLLLALTNVGFSVLFGAIGWGTTGYLLGTILSYAVSALHMRIYVNPFGTAVAIKKWRKLLGEYRAIVLVQLPANVVTQMGNEIPTQFFGRVFGGAVLGGYTMVIKILSIPVSVLSVPVNRVVYQTMAEKANKKENVGEFIFDILEKNIKVALVPVGLLIIFGEKIVPFVLGNEWSVAGSYIPVLGMMFLLKYCSSCVSGTFVAVGRQNLSLIMSFINMGKYGLCFGISYILSLNFFATILLYTLGECLFQLLNIVLCVRCTGYPMRKISMFLLKYIVVGNMIIYGIYFFFRVNVYV